MGIAHPTFLQLPFTDVVSNSSYSTTIYTVGHLTDRAIKNRSAKDVNSTFLYSNSLPQAMEMNGQVWASFETYLRTLANNEGKEIYVITGGRGSLNSDTSVTSLIPNDSVLTAPSTLTIS